MTLVFAVLFIARPVLAWKQKRKARPAVAAG
jgi:hypothetical protein